MTPAAPLAASQGVDVLHALRQRHFEPAFAAVLSAKHLAIARGDIACLTSPRCRPTNIRLPCGVIMRQVDPPDALCDRDSAQSKPGGGTKPTISFSRKRLKAVAVLSRPLAAMAW
jgi:hypothetical protein